MTPAVAAYVLIGVIVAFAAFFAFCCCRSDVEARELAAVEEAFRVARADAAATSV